MPEPVDPLNVAAHERETVRVFALDLAPQQIDAFVTETPGNGGDPWPMKTALGATELDSGHIEVFAASDLRGIGLSVYLTEGQGISEGDIAADREALDAAEGHVVLLRARAFGGIAQSISPRPPLRLLGAYRQAQAEPAHRPSPARPDQVAGAHAAPEPARPRRDIGAAIMVLGVLVLIALVLLFGIRGPF